MESGATATRLGAFALAVGALASYSLGFTLFKATRSRDDALVYTNATRLFLRLLGVVYVMAFASFLSQARGLVGRAGIVPAARTLATAKRWLRDARARAAKAAQGGGGAGAPRAPPPRAARPRSRGAARPGVFVIFSEFSGFPTVQAP